MRILRGVLIAAAVLAAVAYVGIGVLLFIYQDSLLYGPEFTRVAASETTFALRRDGVVLRGWVLNPGKARALLYFGGNGEAVQQNAPAFARWFPDRTVYLVAYRGYGASDGTPSEAGIFADALALYDAIGPRYARVAVVGRSLGSGVATYLASRRAVERVALVTPYDSIAAVAQRRFPIFPVGWLLRDRYESARYAADIRAPVVVIEAADDRVVPRVDTDALVAAFRVAPKVVVLAGTGHNTVQESPGYGAALTAFMR